MRIYICSVLLYALASLCFVPKGNAQKRLLHPSNVKMIAYDRDIDGNNTHMVVFKTLVDLQPSTRIGVTNGLYTGTDKNFESHSGGDPAFAEVLYNGPEIISKNALIAVEYGSSVIPRIYRVKSNLTDITHLFSLETSSGFALAPTTESDHVFMYQGEMKQNVSGDFYVKGSLLGGISLNDIAISKPEVINTRFQKPGAGIGDAGILDCSDTDDICELVEGGLGDLWHAIPSTASNDLIPAITQYYECPTELCPDIEISYGCDTCYDVVFLIDYAETSFTAAEFAIVQSQVKLIMQDMDALNDDMRYAVAHFGAKNEFDLTQPFTDNINEAISFSIPNVSWGRRKAEVRCAFENLMDLIPASSLRSACEYKVILVNRAYVTANENNYLLESCTGNYSDAYRMNVYNTIKQSPFNAEVNSIRYLGGSSPNLSIPTNATICSRGLPYTGPLYPNPQDPEGEGGNRKLIIRGFVGSTSGHAEAILNCNTLRFTQDHPACDNPFIFWHAISGQILSFPEGVTSVEVTVPGVYYVDVACPNDTSCIQSDTITIDQNGVELRSASDPVLSDDFTIYPNPSTGLFNILYELNNKEEAAILSIRNMQGQVVFNKEIDALSNNQEIFLTDVSPGIYYAEIRTKSIVLTTELAIIQ